MVFLFYALLSPQINAGGVDIVNKTVTLKRNFEFRRVYNKGNYSAGKYMVLYSLANNSEKNRLGITASKKIGKSVSRNRIRRLIKESYRLQGDTFKKGHDVVFVARIADKNTGLAEIRREMENLAGKLGLTDKEKPSCSVKS